MNSSPEPSPGPWRGDLLAVLLADPEDTEEMIDRRKDCLPGWKDLIALSFLPERMKRDYSILLDNRIQRL